MMLGFCLLLDSAEGTCDDVAAYFTVRTEDCVTLVVSLCQ